MLGSTLQQQLGLSRRQMQSIVQSTSTVNVWTGAVRSGKTISSLLRWMMFVATAPPTGQLAVIGRTRESLARNVFAVLQDPSLFGELAKQVSYTPGSSFGFILGRRVWVFGASDARAENTVRGLTLAGAYGDECTLWSEELFKTLLGRMSVDGAQFFGTTNPDNPQHWFKKEVVDRAGELGYRNFHFKLTDNQWLLDHNLPYIERIQREYTGLYYRRFILGQWVQAQGAIYDGWKVDRHVIPAADLPKIEHVYAVGCDVGTTNPTRAYALGIGTGSDGVRRLYVVSEWAPPTGLTDASQSLRMRSWLLSLRQAGWAPEWVYVDPAAKSFRTQLFEDGVGNVTAASNAVLPGIRLVQSLLATGQLQVVDTCTHLIQQLPGYVWDPKATAKGEDAPLKIDDHEADALRYAVYSSRALWRGQVKVTLASLDAPGAEDSRPDLSLLDGP